MFTAQTATIITMSHKHQWSGKALKSGVTMHALVAALKSIRSAAVNNAE
jgi:hypothetical protein